MLLYLAAALPLVVVARHTAGLDAYAFWGPAPLARGAGAGFYAVDARPALTARLPAPRSPLEAAARERWQPIDPTGTPFFWPVMRGLLAGPYEAALRRWQVLSIAALLLALALLTRAVGMTPLSGAALAACVGIAYLPALYDVATGNVNALLLVVGALWVWLAATRRPVLTGAGDLLLGLSVAYKPIWMMVPALAVAAAWAAGERRLASWRAAFAVLGVATGVALGAAYMGTPAVWRAWGARLAELRLAGGNVSPLRVLGLARLGVWPTLVALALGVAFVAAAARRGGGDVAGGDAGAARLLALGGVLTLLASPLVWIHYYVLALPAVVVGLRPPWRARRTEVALTLAGALAVGYLPHRLGILAGFASAAVAAAGLVLLAACVGWDCWRARKGASPSP